MSGADRSDECATRGAPARAAGRGLAIACAICAAALAGCGGGSASHSSLSTVSTTPAVVPAGGAKVTAPHFTASRPAHWTDDIAISIPNAQTGRPPELDVRGPVTAGQRDVIRVDTLSLDATESLRAVVDLTRSDHTRAGDTLDPGGVGKTTVDGESAFVYGVVLAPSATPQHHDLVFVRHDSIDYSFFFIAPTADYDRDLPLFKSFLASVRWSS